MSSKKMLGIASLLLLHLSSKNPICMPCESLRLSHNLTLRIPRRMSAMFKLWSPSVPRLRKEHQSLVDMRSKVEIEADRLLEHPRIREEINLLPDKNSSSVPAVLYGKVLSDLRRIFVKQISLKKTVTKDPSERVESERELLTDDECIRAVAWALEKIVNGTAISEHHGITQQQYTTFMGGLVALNILQPVDDLGLTLLTIVSNGSLQLLKEKRRNGSSSGSPRARGAEIS